MRPSISFFCPAYNDQDNLPILIPEVVKVLSEVCEDLEIVIIEDHSPDKTGEAADQLAAQYPKVRVVHHEKNRYYGGALISGFKETNKFEWCFTTDGDRQYDVSELRTFIPYLAQHDAIIGFRRNREMSSYRKLQSGIYNFLVRILFGLKFKDINCSFKIIKRSFLDRISLQSTSAFIDGELLYKLSRLEAKILELPVTHYARKHGQASGATFKMIRKTLLDILTLIFAKD